MQTEKTEDRREKEEEVDPFADFVLSVDTIDWSDETLDADEITARMIGFVDYWDEPEFEGMQPWEIEKKILLDARRPNWDKTSSYGKPYYQHMLTLGRIMFPEVDISPSLTDFIRIFCLSVGRGQKKIINLIGSQNSGKSFGTCFLAFCIMAVDAERSAVFVASPFDVASDATIWGSIEEMWDQLCDSHPNNTGKGKADACSIFPLGVKYANRQLDLIPGLPKAGSIVLKGVKSTGKFKGSKARNAKETDRGVMLLAVDEINEVMNPSFLEMINNLVSQEQFVAVTSQNFKDPEDMGGRITEPSGLYGGASSFEDLDIDKDQLWNSVRSGITLRYDGCKSPNVLANRVIYPQLFKMSNLELMKRDYGEQSPDYYSQVRSFPAQNGENNSVLSRQKISASRYKDEHFTITNVKTKVAFCDPAFGGRDKAVVGFASVVEAQTLDAEGLPTNEELLVFSKHFESIPLIKGATFPGDIDQYTGEAYWVARLNAAGISLSNFVAGGEISYEDQIAIYCKEFLLRNGVPLANYSYDFSMRASIVSSVNKIIGFEATAFSYNLEPEGAMLQNIKQDTRDCCKNRCTELAFLAADYYLTRQIRGGQFIEEATTQLSRTLYTTVNKKYVAEGKKEYKQRFSGVSPDKRDVLMGICSMAHRRGFRQNVLSTGGKNQKSAFDKILALGLGKSNRGVRI